MVPPLADRRIGLINLPVGTSASRYSSGALQIRHSSFMTSSLRFLFGAIAAPVIYKNYLIHVRQKFRFPVSNGFIGDPDYLAKFRVLPLPLFNYITYRK